ncbi:MAG TPA: hypothetical protein VEG64_03010 [Candidatus Sulfotelmatobacter sp.]|nr:hypothetical protein [Candidatus Sulfotelmatobacter sp.]
MREKNYNTGLRGVLFERKHFEQMGSAIWLYGWLVLRQTHQSGDVGWVLGGSPISYREIEQETGFNRRTLERWMQILRLHGYVKTVAAPGGIVMRITKAKKFPHPPRKIAGGVGRWAEAIPQTRALSPATSAAFEVDAAGIDSSLVVKEKDREAPQQLDHKTPEQSGLWEQQNRSNGVHPGPQQNRLHYQPQNSSYEARERQRLLRYEREEATRRELAVGVGPEVISK